MKTLFPLGAGEKETIYNKAIAARAFDILRGFIPAGSTTNLAWHTNLRQAADKIMLLRHHPLLEVRNVAEAIEKTLQTALPNSFGHERYPNTEKYNESWMKEDYYYHDKNCPEFKIVNNSINPDLLPRKVLETRPMKTELPRHLAEAGTLQIEFLLDFGSFRDLQRHRAVIQRMPLLTTDIGFEKWYIEELPQALKPKAEAFLKKQEEKIAKLNTSPEDRQYYISMGYKISNRLTGSLPPLVYLAELRATRFVHYTLRAKAKKLATVLSDLFGKFGLVMHLDLEPDRFDVKRGEHDIVLK